MEVNQKVRSRRTVKIFGERNTGTNYLSQLVKTNFDVSLLLGAFPRPLNRWPLKNEVVRDFFFYLTFNHTLGWKHACLPSQDTIQNSRHPDVAVLALVKNPYSWLLSMYKRPYHGLSNALTFEEFITSPWPILHRENCPAARLNLIELWCLKNSSYVTLEQCDRGTFIRFEDLLDNPTNVCEHLRLALDIPAKGGATQNIEQASKKQDSALSFDYYKDYYLGEKWKAKLTDRQINLINMTLDATLCQKLGYELL